MLGRMLVLNAESALSGAVPFVHSAIALCTAASYVAFQRCTLINPSVTYML